MKAIETLKRSRPDPTTGRNQYRSFVDFAPTTQDMSRDGEAWLATADAYAADGNTKLANDARLVGNTLREAGAVIGKVWKRWPDKEPG
jgi:hypothetical protein